MTTGKPWQGTATQHRDTLRLIPPLAPEFSLPASTDRAREWALDRRYLLADGIPPCAHGLYLMASCPKGTCRTNFRQLDHARIWVPADGLLNRPFLLAHPYASEITADTRQYAKAHGLDVMSGQEYDWYGHGTLPVQMTLPDNWPLWPAECTTAILLATQPVEWPASPLFAEQDTE